MSTEPPNEVTEAPRRETDTRGDERARGRASSRVRMASAALGGALVALGLKRRSLRGAATALAGGWLFYRGITGKRFARPGARRRSREAAGAQEPTGAERSITVGKSADELYDLWRDPETMTRIFAGFVEVTASDEDRWQWTVSGPRGPRVTWETRLVEDRPGEVLRWESTEDATVSNEGSVRFRPAPAGRGTEVTCTLRFDLLGGVLGDRAPTRLDVVPDTLVDVVLSRFKSLAETGEIPTLEGNVSSRGRGDIV